MPFHSRALRAIPRVPVERKSSRFQALLRADGGTRTPDPFITSEVLYQLSYVGVRRYLQDLLFREARSSCSAGYETLVGYCCS